MTSRSGPLWFKIGYPLSDATRILPMQAGIGSILAMRPTHINQIKANFRLCHPDPIRSDQIQCGVSDARTIYAILKRAILVQDRISSVRRCYNTTDASRHWSHKATANTYKSNIGPFPVIPSRSYS